MSILLILLALMVPVQARAAPPLGWQSTPISKEPDLCADDAMRVMLGLGMTLRKNLEFSTMILVTAGNREVNLVVTCTVREGGSRITVVVASASTAARAGEYARTIVDRAR
jgi:hypothetical protein